MAGFAAGCSFMYFYPRPPRGGRRKLFDDLHRWVQISIHALREEGDRKLVPVTNMPCTFLSTPSARRATTARRPVKSAAAFLSTPSARRATASVFARKLFYFISIHALREEGDQKRFTQTAKRVKFLSTPSARRATAASMPRSAASFYFYPRPPRGGRPTYTPYWTF